MTIYEASLPKEEKPVNSVEPVTVEAIPKTDEM
jgi:hypothetical protein